ncbi:ribose-5 phosphate isomerase-related protein [Dunaliella salina]|uniref:ribose-5-phosphate isomerase n=1 Tax=Dunaliella salina TaxID=3046 RepID=A0ABQ7H703_DUNSA|nr:ribose-5 phosphate isomerase-related protein [Dunaliella salina]|eukprot:KAF5842635.1 ribose-5 phosphate isomerase-related protein [Dunaliella salina]
MLASRHQVGSRALSRKTSPAVYRATMHNKPSVACQALEDPKKSAAKLFCDTYVKDNTVIGAGSGELSSLVIESIGARLASGQLKGVQVVPCSTGSAAEAAFCGVPTHPNSEQALQAGLDLAFEEADQLDVGNNACILGIRSEPQQPALLSTFTVAKRARQFILLVNKDNLVQRLRGPLPVLIEDQTWEETAEEVDDLVVGDAEVSRRPVSGMMNPDFKGGSHPYISDEGHNIIDIAYDPDIRLFGEAVPYGQVLENISSIPGVVLTGLLQGLAQAALVVKPEGPKVISLEQKKA